MAADVNLCVFASPVESRECIGRSAVYSVLCQRQLKAVEAVDCLESRIQSGGVNV
jgi:hypothetical protein